MAPTRDRSAPRPTVILATLGALGVVLAVFATAASVIVASDAARANGGRGGERVVAGAADVASVRARFAAFHSVRALVDSVAAPLAPFLAEDSTTNVRLLQLANTSRRLLGPDSLVPDDARAEWFSLWRRHARTAPRTSTASGGATPYSASFALDGLDRTWQDLTVVIRLNARFGDVALSRGDVPTALLRARENLAASRHWFDAPLLRELGVGQLSALTGAQLLIKVAAQTGDSATLRQARDIERRVGISLSLYDVLEQAARADAAFPEARLAMDLSDDEKLPFAVRAEVLYAAVIGGCGQLREVLLGFDPARESHLSAHAARYALHAVLGPMTATAARTARALREEPALFAARAGRGEPAWFLPGGVAARAQYCSALP